MDKKYRVSELAKDLNIPVSEITGQNAKLAAKLTGFKIDIRPESGFYEGIESKQEKAEEEAQAEE